MPRHTAAMRAAKARADDFGHLVRLIDDGNFAAPLFELLNEQMVLLRKIEAHLSEGSDETFLDEDFES